MAAVNAWKMCWLNADAESKKSKLSAEDKHYA